MFKYKSYKKDVLRAISKAEKRALHAIGEFVTSEAKVRAPVDTGNLRGSIENEVIDNDKSVVIGTNTEYAVYVEKGTYKQRAQPYLTPAVEENKSRIKKLAERELNKIG
jgi:HK97 gp10 family phage protein